jgi:hypothetical protein
LSKPTFAKKLARSLHLALVSLSARVVRVVVTRHDEEQQQVVVVVATAL